MPKAQSYSWSRAAREAVWAALEEARAGGLEGRALERFVSD